MENYLGKKPKQKIKKPDSTNRPVQRKKLSIGAAFELTTRIIIP